ncbi:hypothetical protein ABUE31_15230 [Mesorhizobium sp. ZMM04-5]|uniref:MACPF domain-containing protein n=1 Tax=Mesorhizobium marinum TaxID=3228790 RepID=A0ABV3R1Z9_9HYPH
MTDRPVLKDFGNTIEVRTLDDYATGGGYDALKFTRSASALEPVSPQRGGRDFGYCKVWAAMSARQLMDELAAELDLRAAYLGAEAGVAARLVNSFSYNETSFVIIAKQTVEAGNLTIANDTAALHLSKEAREKLANDLDGFHRKFGGYYCHTVVLGGEVYVAYQCTMSTKARAQDVSAEISGTYPDLGSLMVKVSKVMSETSSESQWRMTAQTLGAGGTLDPFDPEKPETVRAAVMKFLRDFEANVRKNPQPYYGRYDGYWRFFDEAADLKGRVYETSLIVDALSDWATGYADVLATIHAFLDPANREGYHVDSESRTRLLAMEREILAAWKILKGRYSVMEMFGDFVPPEQIEGIGDHPPAGYREAVEAMRTQLRTQMFHGQRVYMRFPASALNVGKASMTIPAEEQGEEIPGKTGLDGESWPYVRLSASQKQTYILRPVNKKDGDQLCHGDKVRIEQVEPAYKGQQLYMPDRWRVCTVWTAIYKGTESKKYEWTVTIDGCADATRVVSTDDTIRLTNMNDANWFMCPVWTDYLGVTKDVGDDWKMNFAHSP